MAAKASADDVDITDSRAADPKMEPSEHAHGAKSSNACKCSRRNDFFFRI